MSVAQFLSQISAVGWSFGQHPESFQPTQRLSNCDLALVTFEASHHEYVCHCPLFFFLRRRRTVSGVWSEASASAGSRHRIDVSVQVAVKPLLFCMCRQSLTWVVGSLLKACRNQDSPTPNPVPHIPDASIDIPVILTRAFPSCWSVQEATDEKGETKHQTRSVVCRGCRYTDSRLRIMAVRMHAFPRELLASQASEQDLTGVSNVIVSR